MLLRPLRFVGLSVTVVVMMGGLLTGCSHRPAFVNGEVTSVSDNGDRVCIDTIKNDKTHIICGKRPADDDKTLRVGDCYNARWGSRHEGRFTDIKYAGNCAAMPADPSS